MNTIHRATFTVLGCMLFILVAACGNSVTAPETTGEGLAASGAQRGNAAVSGSAAADVPPEPRRAPAPEVEVSEPAVESSNPAARRAHRSSRRAAARPAPSSGIGVRRMLVAEDVENREPVSSGERFDDDHERLFAFVEATNRGGEATTLVVTFEDEDGDEVGDISLDIPANVPRWRTWAWTRHARTPGVWHAVIRTADGEEVGRQRFEIDEGCLQGGPVCLHDNWATPHCRTQLD